jgi:hypothetical protein
MILFDLRCATGHVFEAWFRSGTDYDSQQARHLIACPTCGSDAVAKAVMAPNVGAKGNSARATPPVALPSAPQTSLPVPMMAGGAPALPPVIQAMFHAIASAQAEALPRSTWVGDRFAAEARAIHNATLESDADTPAPLIHGRATPDEAEALIDDGIMVMPLLVPVVPPEARN